MFNYSDAKFHSPLNDKLTVGLIERLADKVYGLIQQLISKGEASGKIDLTIEKISQYDMNNLANCFIKKYQTQDENGDDKFSVILNGNSLIIQWNGGFIKAPLEIKHIEIETTIAP